MPSTHGDPVAPLLNVELTQTYRTQRSTVVAGYPGHGQLASTCFTHRGRNSHDR